MILFAQAHYLANVDSAHKILVLCYNKAMATFLEGHVRSSSDLPRIEVRTFHSWAMKQSRLQRASHESFDDFSERVVASLLHPSQSRSESDQYDAILIDEAQDFEPDWFRCVTPRLKGGMDGNLIIASDGAQNLYATTVDHLERTGN